MKGGLRGHFNFGRHEEVAILYNYCILGDDVFR